MLTPREADVLDEARRTVRAAASWFEEQEAPQRWSQMTLMERLKEMLEEMLWPRPRT